ncbi:hypothetical protein HBN50_14580 [Halobacteriovorax sp. GB3]|uniref:hypothetical protein n=1 Tax=Halobacteriovorax sp. GB3 TaxID=2719615 RepID=UPI00235EB170|nr:hypothetical protein [Halobacteriovorax sp. GB3]MDD0854335.1 hypothetical protein [Halobacteriovorax sp. GB3]
MDKEVRWKLFFALIALGHVLNGLWMLISPQHWYETLPGRVPDFGPLNEHFVRDLGCAFILIGLVCSKAIRQKEWRGNALLITQYWLSSHALVHLYDTFRGLVSIEHLYMDIPLCYLPPILVGLMQLIYRRELRVN